MARNARLIDMRGSRHGLWTVQSQAGNAPSGGALWLCRCACGVERAVPGVDLRNGKSKGCGCVGIERMAALARTHAGSGSRLHTIWKAMRQRCGNPRRPGHEGWGGRGITICDQWSDFTAFRDWALANGYASNLSIERVDVDGNYCPDNCTWATAKVQARNRRFVLKREDGTTWAEIAEQHGISTTIFNNRLNAGGWPPEIAATWPLGKKRAPPMGRDDGGRFRSQPASWKR